MVASQAGALLPVGTFVGRFVLGSMRKTSLLWFVPTQSEPAATPSPAGPPGVRMVATALFVRVSMRETRSERLSV